MFYVSRDGRQYGPYSAEAVRSYLADGSLVPSDTIREDGSTVWRPIGNFAAVQASPGAEGMANVRVGGGAAQAEWSTVKGTEVKGPAAPVAATAVAAAPVAAAFAPVGLPFPKKRRWIVAVPALAVGLGVLIAAYLLFFRPAPPELLLEGSTTIGDALAPALLKGLLRSEGATEVEDVRGPGVGGSRVIRAKLPGRWRPVAYSIVANGSGNAFKALAAGKAEIGMSSRPVNDSEFRTLLAKGDVRSPTCESIVGLDGLAVVVNRGSSVDRLTRQQVASIFGGRVSDWSQVGGRPGAIHLYGRASDSGTFDTFVALVLGGNKAGFSRSVHVLGNGEAIAAAVAEDAGGIGYVGLAQTGGVKALELSDGQGTTPLLPSPFTVATEDYILSRRLFLYSLPGHSEFASKFLAYALSPEGQTLVDEIGFVKQMPVLESVGVPPTAPAAYSRAVSGLRRMSLNFRFKPDSNQLDNKALADMPRALESLRQNGIREGVAVLGFADSKGTAAQNQRLSEQRAEVVSARLRAYGIQVQAAGFSSVMPVGDNGTVEGREKNRRVEVWAR